MRSASVRLLLVLVLLTPAGYADATTPDPRSDTPAGDAQSRRIAITIDDLPVAPPDRHTTDQQIAITKKLLDVLAKHDAPAIGFVNESKLEVDGEVDPRRVEILELWLDAGHELGNHGYAHLDLHTVSLPLWRDDVVRGERVIRPLVVERGGELRFFRHPFLHTGRSTDIQDRSEVFLHELGYRIAPVTIDNGEWIYANAYATAWNQKDRAAMDRLGRDYVRYMLEVTDFYEGQSVSIAGELIPQTLLIHAYALNADWLDSLLDELETRGYGWIRLEEALRHPAYRKPAGGYTGQGGISWLHRWAITDGMDRRGFLGEPEVPEWVRELSLAASAARTDSEPRPLIVERAEVRDLTSPVNGHQYELRVSLPHGYEESDVRYPVVYLLDADYSFLIARSITDHLAERNHLDEVIVVGVGYRDQEPGRSAEYRINRTRDYTPVHSPDGGYGEVIQKASGGGPKFLEALENDIIPFVDRTYRTVRSNRTLVGHSYGGLFALFAMMSRPGLFSGFVAVSPSLWYGEHHLFRAEEEFAQTNGELPAQLYLCAGSRERNSDIDMVGDLEHLVERLRRRNYGGLSFESLVMENETHNSVFPGCLSNGLRYVLGGR